MSKSFTSLISALCDRRIDWSAFSAVIFSGRVTETSNCRDGNLGIWMYLCCLRLSETRRVKLTSKAATGSSMSNFLRTSG